MNPFVKNDTLNINCNLNETINDTKLFSKVEKMSSKKLKYNLINFYREPFFGIYLIL